MAPRLALPPLRVGDALYIVSARFLDEAAADEAVARLEAERGLRLYRQREPGSGRVIVSAISDTLQGSKVAEHLLGVESHELEWTTARRVV